MNIAATNRQTPALRQQIENAQAQVRRQPEHADSRARLFQWLAVSGDWDRANAQLALCAKLAPGAVAMLALYRSAIEAEKERHAVFSGSQPPRWFASEPAPEWFALLCRALEPGADMAEYCAQALELAPATAGRIIVQATDTQAGTPRDYDWIGDGDSRLAPVCEVIAGGQYGWLPFAAIRRIRMDAPQGLCDLVWAQARIDLVDGREQACLIPARYPSGAGALDYADLDEAALMSRRTAWLQGGAHTFLGVGQKMWMTDQGEHALLDVRELVCGDGAGLNDD